MKTMIQCRCCKAILKERRLEQHLVEKCPRSLLNPRNRQCDYCKEVLTNFEQATHYRNCKHHPLHRLRICEYCSRFVMIGDYEVHVTNKCFKSPLVSRKKCPYCKKLIKDSLYRLHVRTNCSKKECFHKCRYCKLLVPIKTYEEHVAHLCKLARRKKECKYCGKQIKASEYKQHLAEVCRGKRGLNYSSHRYDFDFGGRASGFIRFVSGGLPELGRKR